jgi:hypothetical protein
MLSLNYDFPVEWAAFVNGTADFAATLSRQRFPYTVQGASKLSIDGVKLFAADRTAVVQASPTVDLVALTSGLSGPTGTATFSLAADAQVMQRIQAQQVFMVLNYHFGGH